MQTVRVQVFRHGIRVGAISPGPVITALLADWPAEQLAQARASGSLLEASEVANVVIFMLGGVGTGTVAGAQGQRNDLRKFDGADNSWTWINGSTALNLAAARGLLGIVGAGNSPPGRSGGVAWTDPGGKLFTFGGQGYAQDGLGILNDSWQYSPSAPGRCKRRSASSKKRCVLAKAAFLTRPPGSPGASKR